MSVAYPTEAEALLVLAELRRAIDPATNKPFEAENSRADPAYIRAALAVRRCHPKAQKSNDEPNYLGAARMCMCIDLGKLHAGVAKLVERWVTKLERFEHARGQSTLLRILGSYIRTSCSSSRHRNRRWLRIRPRGSRILCVEHHAVFWATGSRI